MHIYILQINSTNIPSIFLLTNLIFLSNKCSKVNIPHIHVLLLYFMQSKIK